MPLVAARSMHIPAEGDYLCDGRRLVEVLARTANGWRVLDATQPLDAGTELIRTRDLSRWKHVPKAETE
jgi:hypothetical protein